MNYELAKRLKDAGFPQKTTDKYRNGLYINEAGGTVSLDPNRILEWPSHVYVPTLEELIVACGDNFGDLINAGNNIRWDKWQSTAINESKVRMFTEGADSPIEAVANLWLALNTPSVQNMS